MGSDSERNANDGRVGEGLASRGERWVAWRTARSRSWQATGVAILVAVMTVTSLLVGATTPVAGANNGDITVVDLVHSDDVDGDGWVSTFTVEIEADTVISEQGGLGKGEPVLSVWGELENGEYAYLGGQRVSRDDGVWQIPVDGESISEHQVLVRPRFQSIEVRLTDSDSGRSWLPGILGVDAALPLDTQELRLVEEIPFENGENDRLETVRVASNVRGATVSVDGETVGQTPATVEVPVDVASRTGPTTVTVSKPGYHTETASLRLDPPQTIDAQLQKVRKPIVVSSQPAGATVLVDGEEVGTTPYVGRYWVEREVDVEVRESGYVYQSYTDVSAEAGVHAELVPLTAFATPAFDPSVVLNSTTTPTPTPTPTPTSQVDVVDYDQIDNTAVVTGTDSFDYAGYLDSIAPQLSTLPAPVTASFAVGPATPVSATPATFDASDSYGIASSVERYEWTFGDGTSATGETVTHVYADPGSYDVRLRATTEDGLTAETTQRVVVDDRPPVAQFGYDTVQPEAGSSLSLDAGPSTDPEGNLAAYEWTFDDGTSATGETVTHVYDSPGTYEVTLTVRDANGKTDTDSRRVTVREPNDPPIAAFGATGSTVAPGDEVGFDAGSSRDDGTIQTYAWQFGDGADATGEEITHSYTESGTYEVTLTVFDDRGETATETRRVTVVADTQAASADTTATDRPTTRSAETATGAASDTPPETTGGGPGFGVGGAVAALILVALIAWRRDG